MTRDEDIIQIRKLLDENGGKDISIIAKIETRTALTISTIFSVLQTV